MSPPRDRGQPIIVRDEIAPMHNTTFMIHRFAVCEVFAASRQHLDKQGVWGSGCRASHKLWPRQNLSENRAEAEFMGSVKALLRLYAGKTEPQ